ncbi:hypothetical protein UlMin_022965 [Ulmus minor]
MNCGEIFLLEMTLNFIPKLTKFFLFLLAFSIPFATKAKVHELKETKLTLYFRDTLVSPNATVIPVGGIFGQIWSFTQFGTIYASDDVVTASPEQNAPEVGRGQGLYMISEKNGQNAYMALSIVFTNKEYNRSTIELQGVYEQFVPVTELSVVSGTRKFRFAKGFAQFGTYFVDTGFTFTVTWCNITMLHY